MGQPSNSPRSSPCRAAVIFGTRPEGIKLAPVIEELRKRPAHFKPLVWVTAQHREMLDQVLDVFSIRPDRDFDLMRPGQSLTGLTVAVLEALSKAFEEERPDLILVQGDTTTTFAASLAAYYARAPVAHVEAGLRTYDKFAPYPEEVNRRLTTHLADIHFAPTERARQNLLAEGIPAQRVLTTGNTVIDALLSVVKRVRQSPPPLPADLLPAALKAPRMILITGHRRESFGRGFEQICRAIAELARLYPEAAFVYPVHMNPNVREPVFRILSGNPNVHLIEPLGYLEFVRLMDRATLLLTDSGGVQEEAPSLGKPVLVMREVTERPEGVEAGTSRLVGVEAQRIVAGVRELLEDQSLYRRMSAAPNPYGDGRAAQRIAEALESRFCAPAKASRPEA